MPINLYHMNLIAATIVTVAIPRRLSTLKPNLTEPEPEFGTDAERAMALQISLITRPIRTNRATTAGSTTVKPARAKDITTTQPSASSSLPL